MAAFSTFQSVLIRISNLRTNLTLNALQFSVWKVFSTSKSILAIKLVILSNRNMKNSYICTFSKKEKRKNYFVLYIRVKLWQ